MKKWILTAVIVVLVITVSVYKNLQGIPVKTALASKGEVREYLDDMGITALPRIYKISMSLDGRIKPILLKAGSKVKKGQLLATMDKHDLTTALVEADSELKTLKAQIKLNQFNKIENTALGESQKWILSFAEAIKSSAKKLEASKARSYYAKEKWQSEERSKQAISRIKLIKSRLEAAEAKVNYESDQFMHSATLILESMTTLLPEYIKQFLERKMLNTNVLQQRLSAAEAVLARAKRDLKHAEFISPIDGIVLKRYVSNEMVLPAGSLLLEVGKIEDIEIHANILSQEVLKIKPDDPVNIYGILPGTIPMKGSVKRIKPAGFTKTSSLGVEEQRVTVVIKINKSELNPLVKQNKSLGVAYRVRVRVYTDSNKNALKIPRTSLFKNNDGRWQVYRVENSKAVLTNVKPGLINDEEVEIIEGLSLNDEIVISPPANIENRCRISKTEFQ